MRFISLEQNDRMVYVNVDRIAWLAPDAESGGTRIWFSAWTRIEDDEADYVRVNDTIREVLLLIQDLDTP